jgi:Sigma-70, region 4
LRKRAARGVAAGNWAARENLSTVVLYRELKGLTSAETAQMLGLSVSAVKARVFHAKKFLRKSLECKLQRSQLMAKSGKNMAGRRSERNHSNADPAEAE